MSRFKPSNPSQYGAAITSDQMASLIDAGAGLVSAVSAVVPPKKKKAGGGKKPAAPATSGARTTNTNPPPEKKSNTALWVGGGVAALALLGVGIWAVRRGR